MALATLFKSASRDLLERVRGQAWRTPEEKLQVLEELATSSEVKPADAVPFLFNVDHEVRKHTARLLAARKDPATVKLFVAGAKGKPDAARRAALAALGSIPALNIAAELVQLAETGEPADRRLATETLFDLPLSPDTVPLLVRIVEGGEAALRLRAAMRLAEIAGDTKVAVFERLLEDPDERIRLVGWQVVIKNARLEHLDLFLRKVPSEPYATQQLLIAGIQRLLPLAGPGVVDSVLSLLASGNTALRSAALKILLAMPDRVATLRRFIAFSRELAGWVRERSLESLREFGPDVLEPALELLADPEPTVRSAALSLIAGLDDPRVGPAAIRLLRDSDGWLAMNAADVLGRLRYQPALPALVEVLAREEVRWAAVEALGRLGGEDALRALAGLTRDVRPEIRIEALQALALSEDARVLPILQQSAEHDPSKPVRVRAFEMLKDLARKKSAAVDDAAVSAAVEQSDISAGSPEIHRLLVMARSEGASDLHVSVDVPPTVRIGGNMYRLDGAPFSAARTEEILRALLTPEQMARLEEHRQLDACFYIENAGRYRGNLFVDRRGLNGVFRVIPDQPPNLAELGLPPDVAEIASIHQGILIVTGPSGCGKSTTLAALVDLINETRRAHVLTLEDPVEFVHPFKSSLINQRDVGKHSHSYARALRAALREDPDVIVIGEMRDAESVMLALNAAETGHVVLTTLNATTSAKAVDRIIGSFPADEQPQVRESFAGSLRMVLAQTLVPTVDGKGRVACFELLKGTHGVSCLIREGKTYQLASMLQIGASQGMRTFDDSLMQLLRAGKISPETAYLRAVQKETFVSLVPPRFLEELLV